MYLKDVNFILENKTQKSVRNMPWRISNCKMSEIRCLFFLGKEEEFFFVLLSSVGVIVETLKCCTYTNSRQLVSTVFLVCQLVFRLFFPSFFLLSDFFPLICTAHNIRGMLQILHIWAFKLYYKYINMCRVAAIWQTYVTALAFNFPDLFAWRWISNALAFCFLYLHSRRIT